ncbi:MAG: endonuclease/exonuclease/phosphatase family protein [Chitinophagaceae bacterium]|nr:endonuclease/exonuclease/phosphatase family protein [Chitinophagaceae bacterium]
MTLVFWKFTKRTFVTANIITTVLFLLACCNAFLHPQQWWFIALLGLSFPFLLLIVIGFLILWSLFRSKWVFLPLAALILGYSNIRALIGFHFAKKYTETRQPGTLRVMTWNVTWFDEQTKEDRSRPIYRKKMFDFIRSQNPDLICFQEYLEPNTPRRDYNNKKDITELGYPYHHIVYDYIGWKGSFQTGVAIYSKYPIDDSIHIRYPGPKSLKAAESLIGADININGQKVRIFTTHLQSVLFHKTDYHNLEIIKNAQDSILEASKSVVKKLVQGYKFRSDQVDIVRKHLDESPYPTIICGDFNDVPNSYTYFRIKGKRQDAFVEAGRGIGRTFSNISPTLRIDYIMIDDRWEALQYNCQPLPYSEHYPVIADIKLRNTVQ